MHSPGATHMPPRSVQILWITVVRRGDVTKSLPAGAVKSAAPEGMNAGSWCRKAQFLYICSPRCLTLFRKGTHNPDFLPLRGHLFDAASHARWGKCRNACAPG